MASTAFPRNSKRTVATGIHQAMNGEARFTSVQTQRGMYKTEKNILKYLRLIGFDHKISCNIEDVNNSTHIFIFHTEGTPLFWGRINSFIQDFSMNRSEGILSYFWMKTKHDLKNIIFTFV